MRIYRFIMGASAAALAVSLDPANVAAQQTLPTIEVGGQRAEPSRYAGPTDSPGRGAGRQRSASGPRVASAGSGLGAAGPTGPAAAKPLVENNATYRPENAVTATKTNTPIMNIPASIQVVPRAVLNDRQVTEISEAVNNVSGVIAADDKLAGVPSMFIRGFLTNTYYLDGVRMPASPTNTNQNMANVDRVEVVKGPASILYGRGDPGGLVNLITKNPLETPYNAVQQQVGSWGEYRTTLDSTGPITQDKSLLYRLNVAYENWHDFVDFAHGTNIFVAPKIRWNFDEHTYANFYMTYQRRANPFAGTAPAFTGPGPNSQDPLYSWIFGTGGAPIANMSRSNSAYPPWSRTTSDEIIAGYNISSDLNENWNLKHRFQTQLTNFSETFGGPSQWNPLGLSIQNGSPPFQIDQYAQYVPNIATHSFYVDATLTGNFSTLAAEHTLLAGSDFQYFDSNYQSYSSSLPSIPGLMSNRTPIGITFFDPTSRFDSAYYESWRGAYVQDQIKLPYDIYVMAGARYDHVFQYDQVAQNVVSNAQRVTPRFGLLWRPIPEVSVYGSYLTNFGSSPFTSSKPVKPESAEQWEVGVKSELLDKRVTATFAYYDLTKKNIAAIDPNDPTQLAYVSIGEARNRGVELDIAGEVAPGLRVIGGYSYIASIITKDTQCDINNYNNFLAGGQSLPGGCIVDNWNLNNLANPILLSISGNQGKRLGGVPRNSGSIWATYEVQEGDFRGLKFGGGITARSLAQGDNFNSFHTPGYGTVGLMTAYETKFLDYKTTFQVNVNNLLDTRYYYTSNANAFSVITGTPRSVKGSIKVTF